jgi:hypothetical protein
VLSSQVLSVALSAGTAPSKQTEATPASVQDSKNDRFVILPGFGADGKAIIVTRHSAVTILAQSRALAHAPIITAARQVYVGQLDAAIAVYDQLDASLKNLEGAYHLADYKLSHVISILEERLKDTKIISTVGSAVSIIGVILLFTPLAPVGAGLAAVGTVTSVGSDVAQSYFFDTEASKAFTEVINGYKSSSKVLEDQMKSIETMKDNMLKALSVYLALAQTYPSPEPPADATKPSAPVDPKAPKPDVPYVPNHFSQQAAKGLALAAKDTLAAAGKNPTALGKVGVGIESDLVKLLSSTGVKSFKNIEVKAGGELAEALGEF